MSEARIVNQDVSGVEMHGEDGGMRKSDDSVHRETEPLSPLPWRFEDSAKFYGLKDAQGFPVIQTDGVEECQCDLQFIVRACNNHADLLAALKALGNHMDRAAGDAYSMAECPWCGARGDGHDHAANCDLLAARAVIRKAEGRE